MPVFNQLDRAASAALIDKIKGRMPAPAFATDNPRVLATEAAIVAHAEEQARARNLSASPGLPAAVQSRQRLRAQAEGQARARFKLTPCAKCGEPCAGPMCELCGKGQKLASTKLASKGKTRSESAEQSALIQWWALACRTHGLPEFLLFSVPNGAAMMDSGNPKVGFARMAKLKREGLRPGVCDLLLPVARGGFFGLAVELKRKPNKPSDAQLAFISAMEDQGWRCEVCYSCAEAIIAIEDYLSHQPTAQQD